MSGQRSGNLCVPCQIAYGRYKCGPVCVCVHVKEREEEGARDEMAGVSVLILSFYCSFSRSTEPVESLKIRQFNISSTKYLANTANGRPH